MRGAANAQMHIFPSGVSEPYNPVPCEHQPVFCYRITWPDRGCAMALRDAGPHRRHMIFWDSSHAAPPALRTALRMVSDASLGNQQVLAGRSSKSSTRTHSEATNIHTVLKEAAARKSSSNFRGGLLLLPREETETYS